jgi:hypothetical protein
MDKVVFFGYTETIKKQKAKTESFLKTVCGVDTVEFVEISHSELGKVREQLKNYIVAENDADNRVYIDVTGGASIVLVALGMIAEELKLPIHMYDIETGKLSEFDKDEGTALSANAHYRKIELDLNKYIMMQGCKINKKLHKKEKDVDGELLETMENICEVFTKYSDKWIHFTHLLKAILKPKTEDMRVDIEHGEVLKELGKKDNDQNPNHRINNIAQLTEIFKALEKAGALLDYGYYNGAYHYRYSSQRVFSLFTEEGTLLEMFTYFTEKNKHRSGDCMVGVHIDWDGVIHQQPAEDVLNEIDVLTLNGYVPTFISCKSGRMDGNQALYAMYELETVASRFGGRHAKKVLVIAKEMSEVYRERAIEMGIEVRDIKR